MAPLIIIRQYLHSLYFLHFSLTNHTSFVYLCTRAFNNRFWPRFNFTLFTYKIDWNVFVITKPKTQVAYDYFLHLSNLLFPQMTWEESYPLYEKKRIDDSFGLEWIYLPNMLALLLWRVCVLNYFICMFEYFKFMKIINDCTKVIKLTFSIFKENRYIVNIDSIT